MHMIFYVVNGRVLVDISGVQFSAGKGCVFQVPRGESRNSLMTCTTNSRQETTTVLPTLIPRMRDYSSHKDVFPVRLKAMTHLGLRPKLMLSMASRTRRQLGRRLPAKADLRESRRHLAKLERPHASFTTHLALLSL
ncbi:hypothetical protein BJY04DRAFT_60359 [Aspergillus karnatakaensis]|uniref:Cupin domain protein n=1 Tax=Aspergillus karnatakaensis TaxID=1810916 RepID=UPI003CCCAD77